LYCQHCFSQPHCTLYTVLFVFLPVPLN
jgi:hypothetical protein